MRKRYHEHDKAKSLRERDSLRNPHALRPAYTRTHTHTQTDTDTHTVRMQSASLLHMEWVWLTYM